MPQLIGSLPGEIAYELMPLLKDIQNSRVGEAAREKAKPISAVNRPLPDKLAQ
ncbi:MAG: hypothetical protein JST90_10805 [Bacteroidetes bacterium]|nr:hypothetical protein [Bacteroidota bacterium]